ncbi:MAG TPA: thioredoxin domain-containing protein [Candidatus Accumulibacter phosphatis]|nr:thioredoxin domain-containing protein [Candidatus Accumulibacter phosphatis]HRQ94495.1 thioredoxin domain-containing protein [Candidatus Accumulibacter phosphatis]
MQAAVLPGSEPFALPLQQRLARALADLGPDCAPRTQHRDEQGRPRFSNRLLLESSPYLLQHAHNPVNWFPWGDEAFAEAARLGRPVFLSIGYSTCHWCHVMESESFEDEEIAGFLNSHYVAVKVDREERPDIDAVYMSAVQQLTGSGGWPMSVWLSAAREPFYGGTYFPAHDGERGARLGFLSLLRALSDIFLRDPQRVCQACAAMVQAVRLDLHGSPASPAAAGQSSLPGRDLVDATVGHFRPLFDEVHGGLRRLPKFPSHLPLRLLLRHHRRSGDTASLHMAVLTLERMAAGGVYDQLAGGFHRYSTDGEWLLPHFEKMLYDNALLVVAYAEAFQLTGRADFARVAREICDYVLREMSDADGGFQSATDADSEGVEGRFFVWSESEIRHELASLGEATTRRFLAHYGVRRGGNWEGSNILHVPQPDEQAWAALAGARARLHEVRARRVRPLRDDKVLASWNGLMISALALAGRIFDHQPYVLAATRAADFALTRLRGPAGRLQRCYKDGQARQDAFLDDYAFLVAGLIDLYEASFEPRYLRQALLLADATEVLFADPAGGWFMTSHEHETLIAREKPAYDGAEPSGTSVALMNVLRLAVFTGADHWRQLAERALLAHAAVLTERPFSMSEALLAVEFHAATALEIVIVWPDGAAATAAPLLDVLRRTLLPAHAFAGGAESAIDSLADSIPFVRGKRARAGRATAYVCHQGRCDLPLTDPAALAALLRRVV